MMRRLRKKLRSLFRVRRSHAPPGVPSTPAHAASTTAIPLVALASYPTSTAPSSQPSTSPAQTPTPTTLLSPTPTATFTPRPYKPPKPALTPAPLVLLAATASLLDTRTPSVLPALGLAIAMCFHKSKDLDVFRASSSHSTGNRSAAAEDILAQSIAGARMMVNVGEAAPVPYVKGAAGVVLAVLEPVQAVQKNFDDYREMVQMVRERVVLLRVPGALDDAHEFQVREAQEHMDALIQILTTLNKTMHAHGYVVHMWKSYSIAQMLKRTREDIRNRCQLHLIKSSSQITRKVNKISDLIYARLDLDRARGGGAGEQVELRMSEGERDDYAYIVPGDIQLLTACTDPLGNVSVLPPSGTVDSVLPPSGMVDSVSPPSDTVGSASSTGSSVSTIATATPSSSTLTPTNGIGKDKDKDVGRGSGLGQTKASKEAKEGKEKEKEREKDTDTEMWTVRVGDEVKTARFYHGKSGVEKMDTDQEILRALRHPNVIQLFGVCTAVLRPALVFHGELHSIPAFEVKSRFTPLERVMFVHALMLDYQDAHVYLRTQLPHVACLAHARPATRMFYVGCPCPRDVRHWLDVGVYVNARGRGVLCLSTAPSYLPAPPIQRHGYTGFSDTPIRPLHPTISRPFYHLLGRHSAVLRAPHPPPSPPLPQYQYQYQYGTGAEGFSMDDRQAREDELVFERDRVERVERERGRRVDLALDARMKRGVMRAVQAVVVEQAFEAGVWALPCLSSVVGGVVGNGKGKGKQRVVVGSEERAGEGDGERELAFGDVVPIPKGWGSGEGVSVSVSMGADDGGVGNSVLAAGCEETSDGAENVVDPLGRVIFPKGMLATEVRDYGTEAVKWDVPEGVGYIDAGAYRCFTVPLLASAQNEPPITCSFSVPLGDLDVLGSAWLAQEGYLRTLVEPYMRDPEGMLGLVTDAKCWFTFQSSFTPAQTQTQTQSGAPKEVFLVIPHPVPPSKGKPFRAPVPFWSSCLPLPPPTGGASSSPSPHPTSPSPSPSSTTPTPLPLLPADVQSLGLQDVRVKMLGGGVCWTRGQAEAVREVQGGWCGFDVVDDKDMGDGMVGKGEKKERERETGEAAVFLWRERAGFVPFVDVFEREADGNGDGE